MVVEGNRCSPLLSESSGSMTSNSTVTNRTSVIFYGCEEEREKS